MGALGFLRLPARICRQQRRRKHFITTPIFYVNGEPHLGHLYTTTLADANFRWNRLKNGRNPYATGESIESDDIFVVGTDEHGLKVQKAAERAKKTPIEHCNFYSQRFRDLFQKFDINYTHFIRTSQAEHEKAVTDFWNRMKSKGYIYKGTYEGWYSIRDECFYANEEIETVKDEKEGEITRSIETKTEVEWIKEENYMKWLDEAEPIAPSTNLPAVLQSMRANNSPLSLSRDSKRLQWGIRVPDDPSQTIYVWFDALVSYLTAGGYPSPYFKWPADVQFVGKDIRTFHALYWPAFLMAAELPLPKKIYIHSHWLADGIKMTKSLGNVVNPFLVSNVLTTDGLRYFLLKQGTLHSDANFMMNKAVHLVNTDLVNNLANLISRSTGKAMNAKQKYPPFDLEVMEHVLKGTGEKIVLSLNDLAGRVGEHYDKMLFHRGLEELASVTKNANAFFQLHQPWRMSEGPDKQTVLFIIYETVRIVSLLLQPIVPAYADRVLTRLGIEKNERNLETAKFSGGPTIKLYNRPLGEECQIMQRLEHNQEELNGQPVGRVEI
ncbi:Methionine--tRNA ligase, mitochondrial [Aphelenchoides bicaudatus]|nr:Methionine--tRNA ligase, mitochondrial [Aphelenchoides bicaudatus]